MFDCVVDHYDLVNTVLSFGLDRRWRRATARAVRVQPGDRVLDLGCGTALLGRLLTDQASVVGLDVSHRMLLKARRTSVRLVEGSAFSMPFQDSTFDAAVSGFVLRNLDDLTAAFGELARVIRPGGAVALVDITQPNAPMIRRVFDAYFRRVAPALGRMVGQREAYRYLVRSLAQLPPPSEVRGLLMRAGFDRTEATPLSAGMVTLFTGNR